MIPAADRAAFVERIKAERIARGLPPTIVDDDALRLIAALARKKQQKGGVDHAAA